MPKKCFRRRKRRCRNGQKCVLARFRGDQNLVEGKTAIESFGRPKTIELLILVDRRFSRELPIQPDYKGVQVDVYENQKVNVKWNDNKHGNYVYIENMMNGKS